MTTSYLINGKPAQGDDFIPAIDALPTDDASVSIKIPNKGELIIFRFSEGFWVNDQRPDGSTWTTPTLDLDRVRDLVRAFIEDRVNWRDGLEWELTSLATRDARRRTLRLALIGAILIALALWLTRVLSN